MPLASGSRLVSLATALGATLVLSGSALAKPKAAAAASPLPVATPESQGMSAERLSRLHAGIQRFVDEGQHAGQFGWWGAATTYASLDPKEKTLALLFVQHFPGDEHGILWRFSTLFYQAIAD